MLAFVGSAEFESGIDLENELKVKALIIPYFVKALRTLDANILCEYHGILGLIYEMDMKIYSICTYCESHNSFYNNLWKLM